MNYARCILRKCDMCRYKNKCFKENNRKVENQTNKKVKNKN